ncbi:MAG: DUF4062 domain-containing protein [Bryobacteraceae bacterium]
MARTETVLRVFVSSPSDVEDEAESIRRIIDELNRTALRTAGLRLEAVTWRADVVPGVSDDVQSLINQQIGEDYDIFIGVLWARFGRPTPRAGSGTEEEFERAYSRHRSQPDSVRVMVYFKTSPIPLDSIDADQIKQLQRFKSQLGKKGALYCEFETRESFEVYLRSHLTKQVQSWSKDWGTQAPSPPVAKLALRQRIQADTLFEEGALDLIEVGLENFTMATDSIARVGRLFEDSAVRSEEKTGQLRTINDSGALDKNKERKRILNSAALDLTQFAKGLEDEAKLLSGCLLAGLDAFSRVLTYKDCFTSEDIDGLTNFGETLTLIRSNLETASVRNREMKQAIEDWPRMTTTLNKARRTAVSAIEQYDSVLREALQLSKDAKQNYDDLRPQGEQGSPS